MPASTAGAAAPMALVVAVGDSSVKVARRSITSGVRCWLAASSMEVLIGAFRVRSSAASVFWAYFLGSKLRRSRRPHIGRWAIVKRANMRMEADCRALDGHMERSGRWRGIVMRQTPPFLSSTV